MLIIISCVLWKYSTLHPTWFGGLVKVLIFNQDPDVYGTCSQCVDLLIVDCWVWTETGQEVVPIAVICNLYRHYDLCSGEKFHTPRPIQCVVCQCNYHMATRQSIQTHMHYFILPLCYYYLHSSVSLKPATCWICTLT